MASVSGHRQERSSQPCWRARCRWRRLAGGLVLAGLLPLGACGITLPFIGRDADAALTTGSLPARPSPKREEPVLDARLDGEDMRRALAALGTALDPQGNGARSPWSNSESGASGAVSAVGLPFVIDDRVCRSFLAEVTRGGEERRWHGRACRQAPGTWAVTEIAPFRG